MLSADVATGTGKTQPPGRTIKLKMMRKIELPLLVVQPLHGPQQGELRTPVARSAAHDLSQAVELVPTMRTPERNTVSERSPARNRGLELNKARASTRPAGPASIIGSLPG